MRTTFSLLQQSPLFTVSFVFFFSLSSALPLFICPVITPANTTRTLSLLCATRHATPRHATPCHANTGYQQEMLDIHKTKWDLFGLSYFRYKLRSQNAAPFRVTSARDSLIEARDSQDRVVPNEGLDRYFSVLGLFELVQDALLDLNVSQHKHTHTHTHTRTCAPLLVHLARPCLVPL